MRTRPILVFLAATVVYSVLLAVTQFLTGVDPSITALHQFAPALGLATTWLVVRGGEWLVAADEVTSG